MSNFRSFKKIWNPKEGRFQFQNWQGGVFFDNITDVKPSILKQPSITGLGHQPLNKIKDTIEKSIESEAEDIGDKIINRLKSGKGIEDIEQSIESRLKKLINL